MSPHSPEGAAPDPFHAHDHAHCSETVLRRAEEQARADELAARAEAEAEARRQAESEIPSPVDDALSAALADALNEDIPPEGAGAEGGGPDGSFFQTAQLSRTRQNGPATVAARVGGRTLTFERGPDVLVSSDRPTDRITVTDAPVVFVGYGATAPERQWNDFKGQDLRGKILVVLVNDADFEEPALNTFGGKAMTYYGRWTYKFQEAGRRGAAGVLVVHETAGAGYGWYEVSNWAKPGGECRHNLLYWRNRQWWGAGPGAHSFIGRERFFNVKRPERYAQLLRDGHLPVDDSETVTDAEAHTEAARALRAVEARASLYRGSDLVRLNALGRLAHPAADLVEMLRQRAIR